MASIVILGSNTYWSHRSRVSRISGVGVQGQCWDPLHPVRPRAHRSSKSPLSPWVLRAGLPAPPEALLPPKMLGPCQRLLLKEPLPSHLLSSLPGQEDTVSPARRGSGLW